MACNRLFVNRLPLLLGNVQHGMIGISAMLLYCSLTLQCIVYWIVSRVEIWLLVNVIGTTSQKARIGVNYDYVHYKPNTTKSLITAAAGSEGSFRGEPNPRETTKSCGEVLSLRLSKVTSILCTNFDRSGGCDREAGTYIQLFWKDPWECVRTWRKSTHLRTKPLRVASHCESPNCCEPFRRCSETLGAPPGLWSQHVG